MRRSLLGLPVVAVVALASATAAPPGPPGPKPPPFILARDLAIQSINVTFAPGTAVTSTTPVATIEVTARDWCKAPGTIQAYVTVGVFKTKGTTKLFSVGKWLTITNGQPALLSLDVAENNILSSYYLYAEVDPQNKFVEISDANNYMTRNPSTAPFPPPANECHPK